MKEIAKDSGGGKFSSRMGIARPQLEKTEVKESSTHIDQDHTNHVIFLNFPTTPISKLF